MGRRKLMQDSKNWRRVVKMTKIPATFEESNDEAKKKENKH